MTHSISPAAKNWPFPTIHIITTRVTKFLNVTTPPGHGHGPYQPLPWDSNSGAIRDYFLHEHARAEANLQKNKNTVHMLGSLQSGPAPGLLLKPDFTLAFGIHHTYKILDSKSLF